MSALDPVDALNVPFKWQISNFSPEGPSEREGRASMTVRTQAEPGHE
jgi:hypothetical protein